MQIQPNYLYGVVPAGARKNFGPIGPGGGEVHTINDGGVGIVAGRCERIPFSQVSPATTLQYLAGHQRVLEQVMLDGPVIPLKFGTYADDDRQILAIINCGQGEFAMALRQYAGKVEVDLAAFWTDIKCVLADIAVAPSVVALKAQIANGTQATMEQRVRMGQLVKQLLDQQRDGVAAEIAETLGDQTQNMVVNPVKDDSMIFNAALLVGRDEQAQLDLAIQELDRQYNNKLNFRCVGPLPPYSFATAEVKTIETGALDAARRLLELGEAASLAEIKAAHRRLLHQEHPDRNSQAGADDRMQEIADAYSLLEEYAMNVRHAFDATTGAPVIVKVRSLTDLRVRGRVGAGRQPAPSRGCHTVEAA